MNIGDLFLALLADGSRLESGVVKEAEKAGDAGAKTLGKRLSGALRTDGLKVFQRSFGLLAGAVSAGAMKMEEATADFASQTGVSMDEAKAAMEGVNRTAGDQRMSLDAVKEAAIRVRRDLGLTGEAAAKMTDDFARFARVTKQDAAGAVSAFDDILDAWNMTAADAGPIMDKLLVAQQKYGGSITDNQAALKAMAPSLQAMGSSLDDGIELLNLFAASGIDASQTTRALNTAVKNLKPGQSLDDLVREIAAIEDPAKRAQRAIEVFGSRGGVALANALRPGMESLDEFGISAEEAAGATQEAADKIDGTFTGRIKKAISQAGAWIRGLGADFGPALTGMASLVSLASSIGLTDAVSGAFRKVGSSSAVKAAAAAAGAVGGAIYAAAAGASEKLVGALAGAWGKVPGSSLLTGAIGKAGTMLGGLLATSVVAALAAGIGAFFAGIEISKWIKGQSGMSEAEWTDAVYGNYARMGGQDLPPGVKASTAAQGDKLAAEWGKATLGIPKAMGRAIRDGAGIVGDAAGDLVSSAKARVRGGSWEDVGHLIPQKIAEGILADQALVTDALADLRFQMKNELSPAKEIARTIGILTSKELARGLSDKRPGVRAEAERVRAVAEERLATLIAGGGTVGQKASEKLAEGLRSKSPKVRREAQRVQAIVTQKLNATKAPAAAAGETAARSYIGALRALLKSMSIIARFRVSSSGGGEGTIGGRASGGGVRAGVPYLINEATPRSEVMVPSTGGHVLTRAQATDALRGYAGGGATTYNIPVHVQGALPVRSARDVVTELRRVGELGQLPAPMIPPMYRRKEASPR